MNRTAYVFAPPDGRAPWRWCVPGDGGDYTTGTGLGTLPAREDAADEPGFSEVVLVVPGEVALSTRVTVPTRSRRQLEAALPYLVEEHLAEDVDTLHLAAGARRDDGAVPVHALRPDRLRGWLDELAHADLHATAARLDHDALTLDGDVVEVWIGARRALVRGGRLAFAVEREALTTFLGAQLGGDASEGERTYRIGTTADADADMLVAELAPLMGRVDGVRVERRELGRDLEASVAEGLQTGPRTPDAPIELLTGGFRPARRRDARPQHWRLVAGLLLGWLLVEAGLDAGRAAWLEARTDRLRAENLELFRTIVPGRTRSPDPRRELESMLGEGGGRDASFLALLGMVGPEFRAAGGDVVLRSLNWNAQRGDLAVDLTVPGIAQVDRFKAQLEEDGFPVTIDSAVQEQAGVRARLRIDSGGGP